MRFRARVHGPTLLFASVLALTVSAAAELRGAEPPVLPLVTGAEPQPLKAQALRVAQALELAGEPLSNDARARLDEALATVDGPTAVKLVQQVFDPLVLASVTINPESRVKVAAGPAERQLVERGWRVFLVKVHNEAGVTAPLACQSPNAERMHVRSSSAPRAKQTIAPHELEARWLDIDMFHQQPLNRELSGLSLEYRVLALGSRDRGQREAKLAFDVGQGTQDLGFRNEVNLLFECEPAVSVVLDVLDDDGSPTMGHFVFRDALGRVYPARTRRLAPDFFFHDQVYRAQGESVLLPPGKYQATFTRGPEYRIATREIVVPDAAEHRESFRLARWIKLSDYGWFSGDHHVHAAGCAHYEAPTEGVTPEDMFRHILGEDLNVGCVLAWGPCWYYQKQFFDGRTSPLSLPRNLMRYDVEVSGFPSSHTGHLCLLRLSEDDYPGTTTIEEWPTWDLPVLQWGKEQGGVVGFSHSGWGLQVDDAQLPSFKMPPFDGIGANEFIVDVVHGVCDFISAVDTPIVYELSIWYHTLNCGYTTRISGETDFPCIYGERVGLGRSYVKLDPPPADQPLDYDAWVHGLRDGRSYASDGLCHLFDFSVDGLGVGEPGAEGRTSVLAKTKGSALKVRVRAAALLDEQPRNDLRRRALHEQPYWHVERARIGDTRTVPVELIMNGRAVARREIAGDGNVHDLQFDVTADRSAWIAVRVFPSAHTNPVFVEVDGRPIRASRRSAQWCLDAVDVCWAKKSPKIREPELPAATAAYEVARQAYRQILSECDID
jgi:hypothetical protein